jgi:hypothetical protein
MQNNYPKERHRIRKLWDDIIQLIAMEEELFTRLDELELEIKTLTKRINGSTGIGTS